MPKSSLFPLSKILSILLFSAFTLLVAGCGGGDGGGDGESPDTTQPVITLTGEAQVTIEQGTVYQELGATATDDQDGVVDVNMTGEVNSDQLGEYIITYTATDSAGNEAKKTRKVTVVFIDREKPVITLIGSDRLSLMQGDSYQEPGATAVDDQDGPVDVSMIGEVNSDQLGEYIITYTATDSAGNEAKKTRKVTVVFIDREKPIITLIGHEQLSLVQGNPYKELGVTAIDEQDGPRHVTIDGEVNSDELGKYTLTYTAKDNEGNEAQKTRTVTVVEEFVDDVKPIIILKGDENLTLPQGATYPQLGAIAVDDQDGHLVYPNGNYKINIEGQVNSDELGEYTLTYTATDNAGNEATKTRTVTVSHIPHITLAGEAQINLLVGETYQEFGASAKDFIDGKIDTVTTSTVNTGIPGRYTITYSATNQAGNTAIKQRVVKVLSAPDNNAFVTTWNIQEIPRQWTSKKNFMDGELIPLDRRLILWAHPDYPYDYTIDWGDGEKSNNVTGHMVHAYPDKGTYTVIIEGNFPALDTPTGFNGEYAEQLLSVHQWGDIEWRTMENMFEDCTNLRNLPTNAPNLSQVQSLESMFDGARNINADLSRWDTSTITNMRRTFAYTPLFNQPLNSWVTTNVTDMSGMFRGSAYNQPVDRWVTSSVTDISAMFADSDFNQSLNSFDTTAVTDMSSVFANSDFNQPLDQWVTTSVTNMTSMFFNASKFNQPLNSWDTSSVTTMKRMFSGATAFNQPLNGQWNTSKVENMEEMFMFANAFNQPLAHWDVTSVTSLDYMLASTESFNQPLNDWVTPAVTTMQGLFENALIFNQPLDNWNTSNVTNMSYVFSETRAFNQPITWDTSSVTNMQGMFGNAVAFDQSLEALSIESLASASSLSYFLTGLTNLSSENYSALLVSLVDKNSNREAPLMNVVLNETGIQYTAAGKIARETLIQNFEWSFHSDADINNDGCVNDTDYQLHLDNFGKTRDEANPRSADINRDGTVDWDDYAIILQEWSRGCTNDQVDPQPTR